MLFVQDAETGEWKPNAESIIETARGAKVAYHDPYVPVIKPTREHPHWAGTKSVKWSRGVISKFDAVLISTKVAFCVPMGRMAAGL